MIDYTSIMFGDLGIILLVFGLFILMNRRDTASINLVVTIPMIENCKKYGGRWKPPWGQAGCCENCPKCPSDIQKCNGVDIRKISCPYYCGQPFRILENKDVECKRIKC